MLKPLADMPMEDRRNIAVVLTDIDDTLTEHGRLPARAYSALERLKQAGFIVAPDHRPAGRLVRSHCPAMAGRRRGRRERRVLFPLRGCQPETHPLFRQKASANGRMTPRGSTKSVGPFWQKFREQPSRPTRPIAQADLAIDFCEDVPPLPRSEVLKIVAIFERFGATAKISSIHVNGWFGGYDKLSTTRRFLADCFGIDIDRDRKRIVFAGDSPNDSPMFGFFPNSVGVANVLDFKDDLPATPAYVAEGRGADGFAELADMLIAAKG